MKYPPYFFIANILAAALGFFISNYISTAQASSIPTSVQVTIACNNYNFDVSEDCKAPIDWHLGNRYDGFYGQLTSGKLYTQGPILTDRNVFLHKLILEDAFWYVDKKGQFFAGSDLEALSIHLGRL